MKLMAEMMDGSSFDCEAQHWASAADRIAFERKFGTNTAVLSRAQEILDEDGQVQEGADLTVIREEWLAFFAWRELRRHHDGIGDYESFVENLVELRVEGSSDVANPTVQEAPTS